LAADFGAEAAILPWWTWVWAPANLQLISALKREGVSRFGAIVHNFTDHDQTWWKSAIARVVLERFHFYLAHSEAVATPLRLSFPGRPVAVCHLPLHPLPGDRDRLTERARERLALPQEGPIFLFFGFVRPYKGLELLLDAWPRIREQTRGTLVIAGEFWKTAVRRRVDNLSVEAGGVIVHDRFIPDQEVVDFFRAADLVVLPYRSATGTGIVPVATWFKRPVLAAAVPGIVDVVAHEENGLLFAPGCAADLETEAIRFVEMGLGKALAAGVERAEGALSWSKYVSAFLGVLDGGKR
jgi:glycosyltransferase involved in cell wall biosynthesis